MSDTDDHGADSADRPDISIDTHPDLIDPEWNARAEREARKAVRHSGRHIADQPAERRKRPRGVRRRFKLGGRALSALLGLVIAALVFALANQIIDDQAEGGAPAPNGAVPVSDKAPATTATTQGQRQLDLNQPFANTPAAGWADGMAGIVPPAAAPVGKWDTAAVTAAETAVKQTLVDAHLDPKMLVNHDATTYLASLAVNARSQEQPRLNSPTDHSAGGHVSVLASGYPLLPAPIKVAGSMSAATDAQGNLLIHTNYVFAFAFAPGNARDVSQSWQIVAVQHVAEDFTVLSGSGFRSADRGVWPTHVQSYADQMGCTAYQQGYLAPAFSDTTHVGTVPDTDDPNALFQPSHSLTVTNSCPTPPLHA